MNGPPSAPGIPASRAENLRGAALMILAMAGFAVEDVFLKAATAHMPPGQVLLVMGLVGACVFAAMARSKAESALPRAFLCRALLVRSAFEVTGRLFYGLSLALTPLSTTSAILQATPLVVVAAAAPLFGEKVTAGRWLAVLAGFAGVLVILRPGLAGFEALSLLAVAGMLGFAGRDLATRAAPRVLSNRQLGVAGFLMLALAGAILLALSGGATVPSAQGAGLLAGSTVFAVMAYHALTAAMRTGDVSVVTPFRYTRLVFAMILAVTVFSETPDGATLAGSALIVAAGVIALSRGR